MKYKSTIGMEVHVELKTDSKMFCACKNELGLDRIPNSNICPVCTGQPGALPVANEKAIEYVIKAGLALGCEIAKISKFDRKNYFIRTFRRIPDSQYDQPLCLGGSLKINGKKIGITRIHLEEDTGKLLHQRERISVLWISTARGTTHGACYGTGYRKRGRGEEVL